MRCERPECTKDPDCPTWLACINKQCQDPCNCAPSAECRVINHRPQCICPIGYTGDPHIQCTESKLILHCFIQNMCEYKY